MTVYISPNPGKEQAVATAQRAAQLLLMQGGTVLMRDDLNETCCADGVQYLPLEECLSRTDVILTIGGDGTILHEANLTLQYQKPILGINIGRCGFLATCEVDEMEEKLAALVRGEYLLDSRMLLYVRVLGEENWEGHALNDVVVTKGRLQQAIDFSIYCDDILVEHYRGDGVIVATPTGSTAYNVSAGGPIVEPTAENILVTPICAHDLRVRPCVLSKDRVVTVELGHIGKKGVFLSPDGGSFRLSDHDKVELRSSDSHINLVRVTNRSFYEILHQKLGT